MFLGLYAHRPPVRRFLPVWLQLRGRERLCPACDGRGIVRTTDRRRRTRGEAAGETGAVRWSVCPRCGESDQD